MKFHCHQYWLLLSPHNTRDPSVARKTGEEAVLSGGPCWSPLPLSKLAAVRWSPVFLHLHATCGYGNAYQGRKPHTWAPTPTVMRLDVMMTARTHTIHAVISARNMSAILELTFHLFLIIVSFSCQFWLLFHSLAFLPLFVLGFSTVSIILFIFWTSFFPGTPRQVFLSQAALILWDCLMFIILGFSSLHLWIQSTVSWMFSSLSIWFLMLLEHALK